MRADAATLAAVPGAGQNTAMTTDTAPLLDCVELRTGHDPGWTILWLHGLGDSGYGFLSIVQDLVRPDWPALRFLFPHAPVRPITFNRGAPMRAWYDIADLSADNLFNRADEAGVLESVALVEALIAHQIAQGTPPERLILAGFSQGGAITLSVGLRRAVPLAGLIGLSTYVPAMHKAEAAFQPGAERQPLFMAHGRNDPVVALEAGRLSQALMQRLGFRTEWREYPMQHQVCPQEIRDLGDWMQALFAGATR
jgi:phospholipase/carboxylesterase